MAAKALDHYTRRSGKKIMSLAEDQAVPVRLRRAQRTLEWLFKFASENDTGQARRVADFLLSGHKAAENGGWDPVAL